MVWMDTDVEEYLPDMCAACMRSVYDIEEIEQIFWNEVYPAVAFNKWALIGDWQGYDDDSIRKLVLQRHRFGRRLPWRWLHRYEASWWERLKTELLSYQSDGRNRTPAPGQ